MAEPGESRRADFAGLARASRHDLSELVGTGALYCELLARRADGALDQEGQRYLGGIRRTFEHLQVFVDGLTDYARAVSEDVEPERVDAGAVADEVLEGLAPQLERRGASATAEALPEVLADPRHLQTVLAHLVRNALVHGERDGVRITLSAEREGDAWRLSVADDGPGIPERDRERVLEPFSRLRGRDESTAAGVGLAICATLVARQGGRLWIEGGPEDGQGTVVRFTLPAPEAPPS